MGVIEVLKMQERRDAVDEKSHEVVENLIIKLGLSNEQAADIAAVSLSFVKKVRKELSVKK